MSTRVKKSLEVFGILAGLGMTVVSLFGVYFVLPFRVDAIEKVNAVQEHQIVSIQQNESEQAVHNARIEERIKSIQRALKIPTDE